MATSVFKPFIKRRDMDYVLSCLVSDEIGYGHLAKELTKEISTFLGLHGGISLRSYKTAIKASLDAIGMNEGDKLLISALAPVIYADVCEEMGIQMVLADVDLDTGCISLESVEQCMEQEPKALVLHYPLGFVPEIEKILEYQLPIVEDISEGLGAKYQDELCGGYGQFTIIAMEYNNIITSGGGAVVLGKEKKEYNILKGLTEKYKTELLPDMNAALGMSQMKNLDQYIEKRKEIADIYQRAVMRSHHKTLIKTENSVNIDYSYPVVLKSGAKEVLQYARKKGINAEPAFRDTVVHKVDIPEGQLKNAQSLALKCVLFPLYPAIKNATIDRISKVLSTLP